MSGKKKILHVLHSLEKGGITSFVEELVKLNASTNTMHHILVWQKEPHKDYEFNFIDISKVSNKKQQFKLSIKAYDKIFVHSLMPFMVLSLYQRKKDVYLFQHGITFGSGTTVLIKKIYYFCIINVLRFKVISSSNFAEQKLLDKVKVMDKSLLQIIGFGIDVVNKSKSHCFSDTCLNIGFAGRLVDQKKVTRVFDAFKHLEKDVIVKFHIAGDGPLLKHLQKLSEIYSSTNILIIFHGLVTDMDLFYSKLDLFILPSVKESFGLVVLEALVRGVPVIVYKDSGACVEFIVNGQNGYVVEDAVELAEKINHFSDINIRERFKSNINHMNFDEYDIVNTRAKLDKL